MRKIEAGESGIGRQLKSAGFPLSSQLLSGKPIFSLTTSQGRTLLVDEEQNATFCPASKVSMVPSSNIGANFTQTKKHKGKIKASAYQ